MLLCDLVLMILITWLSLLAYTAMRCLFQMEQPIIGHEYDREHDHETISQRLQESGFFTDEDIK